MTPIIPKKFESQNSVNFHIYTKLEPKNRISVIGIRDFHNWYPLKIQRVPAAKAAGRCRESSGYLPQLQQVGAAIAAGTRRKSSR
jgi:hypothetical protein